MGEDIPTEYDVIVVGTGMTESIVAAALSRIGHKLLHLDSNSYYGDLWATFSFNGIHDWITDCQSEKISENAPVDSPNAPVLENCTLIKVKNPVSPISNIHEWVAFDETEKEVNELAANFQNTCLGLEQSSVELESEPVEAVAKSETVEVVAESENTEAVAESETIEAVTESETVKAVAESEPIDSEKDEPKKKENVCWNRSKFLESSRKFNLDLAPKLLFAKGSLVELLISSNIGRYTEFRCVTRVLTWINDRLQPVPCSRADVFSTTDVSVVEKRMLMKLLTSLTQSTESSKEFEGFQDKTFLEYLKSKKLPNNLIHYVLHAIAMGTNKTSFKEGLSRSQIFISSLGRYSNSPFLWPMYGSGELPQSFCRLSAVFGTIYHLQKGADSLIVSEKDNKCEGILSDGQKFAASHIVLGVNSFPETFLVNSEREGLSRGIFIIDRSILPSDKEQLTLLQYPIDNNLVTVIEVGPATCACPSGLYVVHMTCKQNLTAKEDLLPVVLSLFNTTSPKEEKGSVHTANEGETVEPSKQISVENVKPQLLWALYFNMLDTSAKYFSSHIPSNVHLCSGPDGDLDFESCVNQAKSVFSKICPGEEFLPRAPDPEEIVSEYTDSENQDKVESDVSEQEKESEVIPESNVSEQEKESDVPESNVSKQKKESEVVPESNISKQEKESEVVPEVSETANNV